MVQITINSDGQDSDGLNKTYALKTTLQQEEVTFPTISPHQNEIKRARRRDMTINSPFTTYLDHFGSPEEFWEKYDMSQTYYEEFARENATKLVNYSFDFHPDENLTQEMLDAIHNIQINAHSPFFFDYEVDITQDEKESHKQFIDAKKWLSEQNSNKILVPVINMKIYDEGLFLRKLETLSTDFKRINVIYRSPNQASGNWSSLKKFLNEHTIWCHMDCILNRYNNDRIAHRVRTYPIGISSVSIGFPFGGGESSNRGLIYQFNSNEHIYEILEPPYEPSTAERKDRTWINSLNSEIDVLQRMRQHVIDKTLYTEYIPTISSVSNYLAFSKGI